MPRTNANKNVGWLRRVVVAFVAIFLTTSAAAEDQAGRPLREIIDERIAAPFQKDAGVAGEVAPDAEFLRRVYLDLVGTIPTSGEARAFLADGAPDKREKLVDRLLASPEHARHMARTFNVALMERRADKHVPSATWQEYLRKSFLENKPWDQMVREILSADGVDENLRPAAKFMLDREAEPHLITRDISRMFLGVNLQCAQCHDHPLVDDYPQDWYYGIYAFLNRSFVFLDKKNKNTPYLAEKADGDVKYTSVFDKSKTEKTTGPRLLDREAIAEPTMEKGQEYEVAPADGVRPVPKFSRRAQLAKHITSLDLAPFKRNIVNRLWAHIMGRGLVHPLDMHSEGNPPSHPELLDQLAEQFAASGFNVRAFLRELALTQTYQRSCVPPSGTEPAPETFAVAALKPLSPEQLAWAMMQATGLADAQRLALGDKLNETTLHDSLAGNVGAFVSTFGGVPGQPDARFQATLDQALFVNNGSPLRDWIAPRAGNLVDRLVKTSDAAAVSDELYLGVLTRPPSDDERRDVAEYLNNRPAAERTAAMQELVWALLASAEFRFNH
jgi:hypothetical protein